MVANAARIGREKASSGLAARDWGASDCEIAAEPEGRFLEDYNRRSFLFRHGLSGHPLFELPSLLELAARQGDRPDIAYWSNGTVAVNDRWEKGAARRTSLCDTIAGIAENESLVMLKHVEQDLILGPMLRNLMARFVALSGDRMRSDAIVGRATILIASPRRITAYHLDADTNFLLQLEGDKRLNVFDRGDRSLVTDRELEQYHSGDANAAIFRAARQNDARTYELGPGLGVHIPSISPHWARTGDGVSVALSLNFDLRSEQRSARIYAFNRRLRRLGLKPTPPGISAWRDRAKLMASNVIGATRHRRGDSESPPTGWSPPAAQP
jgi:hypothetical protein